MPVRFTMSALAAVAMAASPLAAVAQTASAQIQIKSFADLSIMEKDLPAGCKVMHGYSDDGEKGVITCDTKEQFDAGFTVSPKMDVVCTTDHSKYVCTLTESKR